MSFQNILLDSNTTFFNNMLYYFLSNSILKIYSYLQGLFKSEFTKPDLFLYQQRIFNGSITDKSRNHIRVHTSKLRPGNLIRRSLAISLLKDYYERLKPLHLTSRQATTGRVDYSFASMMNRCS